MHAKVFKGIGADPFELCDSILTNNHYKEAPQGIPAVNHRVLNLYSTLTHHEIWKSQHPPRKMMMCVCR
jgi:hypothetical protein